MFTQEELIKFRSDMLNMCNNLDVEVDSQFNSLVLNSKYVEKTLARHRCETTDELIKFLCNWFIEHPDYKNQTCGIKCECDYFHVWLKVRMRSFSCTG